MKKAILFISLGILMGLLVGGLYWYQYYTHLNDQYLQAVKLAKLLSK